MNFYNKNELMHTLKKYDFYFKKSLGQNFLINKNIANKIIDLYDSTSNIIEIGPGIGHLTNLLCHKVNKIVAIELDKNMIEIFNSLNKNNNIHIINGDILKINLIEIKKNYFNNDSNISICANIPYYLTSELIFKLIDCDFLYDITLMLQEEVVNRMLSNVGDKLYGSFSIYIKYYFELKKIVTVSSRDFIPKPKVNSAVINMKPRKKFFPNNEQLFLQLISASFLHRRKKLINSIIYSKKININKIELEEIFDIINISKNIRAEEIDINGFIKLSNIIEEYILKKKEINSYAKI